MYVLTHISNGKHYLCCCCYYVYFEIFLELENASCVDRKNLSLPEVISVLTVLDSTCLDYVWDENPGNGESYIEPEEKSQLLKQFSSSLNLKFWNINRLLFPLPHLSFYCSRKSGAGRKRKGSLAVKIELEAGILIFCSDSTSDKLYHPVQFSKPLSLLTYHSLNVM